MIGDAISSVLAGDFPPERREILVVDNGSTDDTAEVIRRHPVTYVHEPRPGVSNARNRGIARGQGRGLRLHGRRLPRLAAVARASSSRHSRTPTSAASPAS